MKKHLTFRLVKLFVYLNTKKKRKKTINKKLVGYIFKLVLFPGDFEG